MCRQLLPDREEIIICPPPGLLGVIFKRWLYKAYLLILY